MVDFIKHLDEVGLLSCLASIFVYIAYLRRELIYVVISSIVVYPSHREIFLITELVTILWIDSSLLGFGVLFSLVFSHFYSISFHIIA
jgi:hypothetical protein